MACMKWMPQYNRWVLDDGRIFRPGRSWEPQIVECSLKHRKDGYLEVAVNGKSKMAHIMVAEAFLPNPENKPTVDHINRNREDNRAHENLQWATYKEQNRNTEKVVNLYDELGVDPELCLSSTEREHAKYTCNHDGFRERKIANARRYASKHYALGKTYHACPDGHRRWHKPGDCPVCKSN